MTPTITPQPHKRVPGVRRWTREEYHAMGQAGLFDDQRVELIDGVVINMAPMLSPHATAIRNLNEFFYRNLIGQAVVIGSQIPILIDEYSEPEPDLYIARGSSNDYAGEHPGPENLLLVIEVSDSTLLEDRKQKGSLYARAGIQEYWLLNIPQRRLEIYRQPQEDSEAVFGHGYALRLILAAEDSAAPQALPGISLRAADVLPPVPSE